MGVSRTVHLGRASVDKVSGYMLVSALLSCIHHLARLNVVCL